MSEKLLVSYEPEKLNIKAFARMLDSTSQCYKYYWLEAILQLMKETGNTAFRFEEIIDRMIANAWYTVTMYHLHLGPGRIDNEYSDKVESAVIALKNAAPELAETAAREEVTAQLHKHAAEVLFAKNELTKNVPFRLLSSFLNIGNSKDWNNRKKIIEIIDEVNRIQPLPYTIINARNALDCVVNIHPDWAEWMLLEYPILINWINLSKVVYLQGKNPEVPGIIYKLEPPAVRNLKNVKDLWEGVLEQTKIMDIYSDKPLNDERYDIDHFVPWSYVAMDEIWNLIPAGKSFNSSKNNRLPDWDAYSEKYLDTHYRLYQQIFSNDEIHGLFKKCQAKNLNSQWAIDRLYIPGRSEAEFKGTLETNLKRIYDAALIQGYDIWNGKPLLERQW